MSDSWSPGSRGRAPDPKRPGTVYRSRPRLFRIGRSGWFSGRSSRRPPPETTRALGPDPSGYPAYPGHDAGDGYPPPYPPDPPYPFDASAYPVDDGGRSAYPPPMYPPPPGAPYPRSARPRRRRRPIVAAIVVVLLGYPALLGVTAVSSLSRTPALPETSRLSDTPGHTYLVVGSDSRQDLTRDERAKLGTGKAPGKRTDTIMILHAPSGSGPTVLVSLPRDSYVPVPGKGRHKINAAYALGGPRLLVQTVEQATGLHIDDYVETGLGGYANLVDAIGGVHICVKRAMKDEKAHINLAAGCQDMDGATALGYARARYSDPRGDLGRVERQREVLAAIASKTLSPAVLALPWRALPAAGAGGRALTVDDGASALSVTRFVLAMRGVTGGNGLSLTVPIGGDISTPDGAALTWNTAKAKALFAALAADDTERVRPLAAQATGR
jgi:LCP family protein required for cell wall assembly